MTRVQHIASLMLVALAVTLAVPAEAMTPLAKTVRNINKRLNLLTALYQQGPSQQIYSQPMTASQNSVGSTFYNGTVGCPDGWVLTGGGVDWGASPRGDWVINYSSPGNVPNTWSAGAFGGGQAPTIPPKVYAVCIAP